MASSAHILPLSQIDREGEGLMTIACGEGWEPSLVWAEV